MSMVHPVGLPSARTCQARCRRITWQSLIDDLSIGTEDQPPPTKCHILLGLPGMVVVEERRDVGRGTRDEGRGTREEGRGKTGVA